MLFDAVRIESLAGNVIGMHVDMDDLMRALKSAQSASETNVRLTKRQGHPCLSFQLQINQVRANRATHRRIASRSNKAFDAGRRALGSRFLSRRNCL